MTTSEVAHFKHQQALQETAAQLGLSGLAAVTRHAVITARLEQEAERLIQLMQDGQIEQAEQIITCIQQESHCSSRESDEASWPDGCEKR